MDKDAITTDRIAPPAGPFSPAIRAGDTIYLSGQVGQDPATGSLVDGGVTRQTEQIFRNLSGSARGGQDASPTSSGSGSS